MTQIILLDSGSTGELAQRGGLSKLKTALRALRHRNYRLFFAGQLISLVGTWMQMIAQSWLAYRLTGSSFLLGAIGFASRMPIFLLAFVGGTIADRYNRRRVVIATQVARGGDSRQGGGNFISSKKWTLPDFPL